MNIQQKNWFEKLMRAVVYTLYKLSAVVVLFHALMFYSWAPL